MASRTARALLISPPALSDEDTASCAALAAFPVAARVEAAVSGAALSAARAAARLLATARMTGRPRRCRPCPASRKRRR